MAISVKVRKGSATTARARRHFRLRKKIAGTASRPRLVVSRSARHLFVQIVDDSQARHLHMHQPWKMRYVSHLQIRLASPAKLVR